MDVQSWLGMGALGLLATMATAQFIRPNSNRLPNGPEWLTLISASYAVVGLVTGVGLWLYNVWAR